MNSKMVYEVLAVISTLGLLSWMVTAYFGGMYIYFITFGYIIIPVIVLYIVSFGETIISFSMSGFKENKVKILFHGFVVLSFLLTNIYKSEFFESERI